ncbi:MAG: hypothetical protein IIA11_06610 [Proteobacteria bacterium]|nr:hypothetical protein [Pseudomonadota bacterium]
MPNRRHMIRRPFALEKMRYDGKSGTVIYRSKLHAAQEGATRGFTNWTRRTDI